MARLNGEPGTLQAQPDREVGAFIGTDREKTGMKAFGAVALALVSGLVAVGMPVLPGAAEEPKSGTPTTTVSAPVYKPPLRGAPGGRVGGGTRSGSARDMFVLSALVPDDSGQTISEQPSLYWFISSVTTLPVEVAITDPRDRKSVV